MRNASMGLLGILALAGCSDAGTGTTFGGTGGGGIGISGGSSTLGAMCDYFARCPQEEFAFQVTSQAECTAALDFLLTCRIESEPDEYGIDQWSVSQVDVKVDPATLAACEAWLRAADCDAWRRVNEGPCGALGGSLGDDDDDDTYVPPPPAGEGESCQHSYSCQEGLLCVDFNGFEGYPSEEEQDLCRVCVEPGEPGDDCAVVACRWDEEVQARCDQATRRCVAAPTSGPCLDGYCANGFFCDAESETCMPRGAEGQECAEAKIYCAEGLHCSRGLGTCQPPEPDGSPCGQDKTCASEFCNGDLKDEDGNHGICDPGGFEGAPCDSDSGCRERNCEHSLKICIELRPDGAPCYKDFQCTSGFCDPLEQACGRRVGGQPCEVDQDCAGGHCDPGTSKCGLPDGADCWDPEDCQGGACESGECVTQSELGGPCNRDEECVSDRCWGGECKKACYTQDECDPGQWCDDWNARACLPLRDEGEYCEEPEACKSGWCSSSGQCGTKPGFGDPCEGDDCYPWGQCREGVCAAQPGPGQACQGYDACIPPYACIDGTCTRMSLQCRPAQKGELCTFFVACAEGLWCDVFNGFRCAPRAGVGDPCTLDWQCPTGTECSGTCVSVPKLKPPGEPCESDRECQSDYCSDSVCQAGYDAPECVMP